MDNPFSISQSLWNWSYFLFGVVKLLKFPVKILRIYWLLRVESDPNAKLKLFVILVKILAWIEVLGKFENRNFCLNWERCSSCMKLVDRIYAKCEQISQFFMQNFLIEFSLRILSHLKEFIKFCFSFFFFFFLTIKT